jgi:hypothetical protein
MNENETDPTAEVPEPEGEPGEPLPPYVIEAARSSRSRCKSCRRPIEKGTLRIGILSEGGFYGPGYLWHHLTCAARRQFEKVEEAYGQEAWKNAKVVPESVPGLDELRGLREKAEEKKRLKKELPYVEEDPSGRAKCKQCGQPIEKGSLRVALGKDVTFGNQTRTSTITVHPHCVKAALEQPDSATEAEGLREALLENSGLPQERIDAVMREVETAQG